MCGSDSIEPIQPGVALACMLLNIFFFAPLGTWIHACNSEKYTNSFLIGLAQFVLLIFFPFTIIGWIWAIIYGVQIYQVSTDHARKNAGGNYMAIRAPMMGQPQGPYMVAAPGGAYNMAQFNQGGAPHQMQYMQQQQMQYVQQ